MTTVANSSPRPQSWPNSELELLHRSTACTSGIPSQFYWGYQGTVTVANGGSVTQPRPAAPATIYPGNLYG